MLDSRDQEIADLRDRLDRLERERNSSRTDSPATQPAARRSWWTSALKWIGGAFLAFIALGALNGLVGGQRSIDEQACISSKGEGSWREGLGTLEDYCRTMANAAQVLRDRESH